MYLRHMAQDINSSSFSWGNDRVIYSGTYESVYSAHGYTLVIRWVISVLSDMKMQVFTYASATP
ncbi:hypothetical protein KDK_61160 [Dictyobacter kobayashii]|uniref:Uncharacterized protein n=1 Tax=Dictyobacter kobayashii TaxID=2014872 RepID=A0A402AT61_9CHLR|nr:hypothetical protein KDK_61160 [Dictyobacter kobayashii]